MKEERSLYDQIELYVLTHEPCYQKDIVRCFEGKYSKQYIMQTCYKLWEDARISRRDIPADALMHDSLEIMGRGEVRALLRPAFRDGIFGE